MDNLPPHPLSPSHILATTVPFPLISTNPSPLVLQGSRHMPPPPEALLTHQPTGILTLSDLSTEPDTSLYTPCHKSVLFQDIFFPQPRAFGSFSRKEILKKKKKRKKERKPQFFSCLSPSFSELGIAQTLKLLTNSKLTERFLIKGLDLASEWGGLSSAA